MDGNSRRTVQLGALFTIKHGYAFKGEYFGTEGSHIVLTPGNFFDEGGFKKKGDKEKWYSGKFPEDYILSRGDLLVAMTEQAEGLLGSSAIVPEDGRYLHNQRLGLIQNLNDVNKRFLYYLFNSRSVRQQIRASCSGVKVRHTSPSRIYEVKVDVPSLHTQRKIVAILSAYDDLIENNLRRIKILEEMAQNLYREWFVKFRFPGHQHARFVDSSLGRIPEGWGMVPLGKLTELKKDKFKEKLHSEYPLLDLAKMQQRTLSIGETGNPIELTTSRIIFEEDDILFGSIRPYLHKVALAPCRGVTNVSVLVIRPTEKILQSFLAVLLSSIDAIRWADQHSTGTKMPVIKWEALQTLPLLLPSQSVLRAFETSVQPMLQTVKMASSRNQALRRTRDLLLPRLISGEVDVSELDIAVPEESQA
jgi:type I restriction enzyme S subunit